ncbi:tRNA 2-thiouridine(34) synthase MnmA [Candidatus Parcubacteria bacterium]|nr:tRNA 2-thiouridine(34) synthase MnmA [Candidatus Parcubacteria bacterium]
MNSKNKKVIMAISGGVDSAVSAFLLQKQNYEVIGIFMRLHDGDQQSEDAARQICNFLGIKFYPINVSVKFKKEVIDYFVESYKKGITPNPCVQCNKFIKFGELFKVMKDLGGDYLATGHYIRFQRRITNYELRITNKIFKGFDKEKDQSYFLYNLKQEQLKKILFPIGGMEKDDVRKIAEENEIPYLKKESQDICFLVRDGKIIEHNEFLKKNIKLKPGFIKTMDGKTVGEHVGLPFYTIGQRRGIDIGGTGPYYAVKMDYETNVLYVVKDPNDKVLFSDEFIVGDVNWISGKDVQELKCEVVIRYKHQPINCKILKIENKDEYLVKLDKPQRAIMPGQSAVFYNSDELLGGGVINRSNK